MWVEVFENGKLIDEGIWTGMKAYVKDNPTQSVSLADDVALSYVTNERKHIHNGNVTFKIYNDLGLWYTSEGIKKDDGDIVYELVQEYIEPVKECSECGKERPKSEFYWTYDRYGIPYKKVCEDCYHKVQNEISKWVYDPTYAGEYLELEEAY